MRSAQVGSLTRADRQGQDSLAGLIALRRVDLTASAPILMGLSQPRSDFMLRSTRFCLGLVVLLSPFVVPAAVPDALAAQEDGDEMTFDAEDQKQVPPSPTLQSAVKLYEKKDYYSASIEFFKVLNGETQDGAANKQRAEFFVGKTLYKMGYYAASLAYFDRIVQAGDAHRYHGATLKWLAALSRVLPETSGILDRIGSYDPSSLKDPIMEAVRDELYYLLGRHFYRQGEFEQAIGLFQSVSRENPFYIKAKFFEGVTYVRQYQGKPALNAFKEILAIGQERPKYYSKNDIESFTELANLQLARIFYSTQQYDLSIKYYEKLDQMSPDWLKSLFEASWAYFMKRNNSKALGNIHSLNAPYFETEFFPESYLLKAVIYYKYCLYDRALEAVNEYSTLFSPLRKDLKEILDKYEDNAEFFEYANKILKGRAGLGTQTDRLVRSVLGDKTLRKTFFWVEELDKELSAFEKADKAWKTTAVASEVLQELTVQKSLAMADAGRLARERIDRLRKELNEFNRDGRKVRIEVLNARAGQVSAEARGTRVSGDHKPEAIVVDDEHFMWKFNGEYWKDELGFYRFRIRSRCPKQGAK
jgi:tetratricopeptide (TPR) repeat protein